MKKTLSSLFALLVLCLTSYIAQAEAWNDEDTAWEAGYLAVHAIDWAQTRDLAAHCDDGVHVSESNPFLSSCPTLGEVNTYFLVTAATHIVIAHELPVRYRRIFQTGTIALQLIVINKNYRMGLHLRF